MTRRITLLLLLCWACSRDGSDPSKPAALAEAAGLKLQTVTNPAGFTLKLPEGWMVGISKGAYIEFGSPDGRARGIVFPFLAQPGLTGEACLEQVPQTFAPVLPGGKLAKKQKTRSRGDEVAGLYSWSGGSARALCSLDGRSGMLYLAITDRTTENHFTTIRAAFASLEFGPPQGGAKTGGASTHAEVDWQDPMERAFRVKVPKGWKTEGGLSRFAPVDVRGHLKLTSPDGAILVALGDRDIPPLATPMMGFPEGSTYNPGYGVNFYVKRYTPGGRFAEEYANRAAPIVGCRGARAKGRELRDVTQMLQQQANQAAAGMIRIIATAGEARFDCGGKTGYVFAATQLMTQSADGSGTWTVTALSGYVAPKEREAEARRVLGRLYETFQINPQWAQAQQNTTAESSRIVSQTGQQIAQIFRESSQRQNESMDRVFRNWSNATLGQADVVDPNTGETWKVASGKNYYWRKVGTNVGTGTDTYDRPDIDFTPLTEF